MRHEQNWVIYERELHAPILEGETPFPPDKKDYPQSVVCKPSMRTVVTEPTVFDRLYMSRCPSCCSALGIPVGEGSPRNNKECRDILNLEVSLYHFPGWDTDDETGDEESSGETVEGAVATEVG